MSVQHHKFESDASLLKTVDLAHLSGSIAIELQTLLQTVGQLEVVLIERMPPTDDLCIETMQSLDLLQQTLADLSECQKSIQLKMQTAEFCCNFQEIDFGSVKLTSLKERLFNSNPKSDYSTETKETSAIEWF
ncbi:hypothetical protein [Parasulfitobacter algicola]|uniref:Uncharacterized protein n=1 Tax=Parasulfitobacter algicola TaxID=2614809 RepID=A0ABX2IRH2_9RHOB|nr:hypothetical protein [Sulfitobacter algicola]NSX55487.1 hypothetical protein [Sulfitobacter algicola]